MTILNRRTFEIKPGKLDEAVAVLQKAHAATAAPGYAQARRERVISSLFGEANLLQGEYEYETLAEYESMWAAWVQTPVAAEFAAGMGPLEVRAHHNDLLQVNAANDVDGANNTIAIRYIRLADGPGRPDLMAADIAEFVTPGEVVARLSSRHTGWWGELTLELEFESLADYEARGAAWAARPTSPAFRKVLVASVRPGGRTEVWRIHH